MSVVQKYLKASTIFLLSFTYIFFYGTPKYSCPLNMNFMVLIEVAS